MADLTQSGGRGRSHRALQSLAELPTRIAQAIEAWRERRSLRRDFDQLRQRGELDRVLSDSGIAPSDVPRLLRAHPHTPEQLTAMMRRLGIDRAKLPRTPAMASMLREMEWQCGECVDWRRCRAWLASAEAPDSYRAFCPNAAALDAQRCERQESGVLGELEAAKGIDER